MTSANDADALITKITEEVINNITHSLDQKVDAIDTSVNALCKKISQLRKR